MVRPFALGVVAGGSLANTAPPSATASAATVVVAIAGCLQR